MRVAKLMTQTELAGKQITRNMLSCIENGTATPSLSTLTYLAGRLGVPVGFLLAEGGDEVVYRKMNSLSNIKKAFSAGDYPGCRGLCLSACPEPDDEILLLLAECDAKIAEKSFWAGNLHAASRFFEEAVQYAKKTIYPMPQIAAKASVYIRYMSRISPIFYPEEIEAEEENESCGWKSSFTSYVDALEAMDGGDVTLAERYSPREEGDFFAESLRLKCLIAQKNYEEAKAGLLHLLQGEVPLGQIQLHSVLSDLEVCCRETEDFKNAYRYSTEKVQVLESLLEERQIDF